MLAKQVMASPVIGLRPVESVSVICQVIHDESSTTPCWALLSIHFGALSRVALHQSPMSLRSSQPCCGCCFLQRPYRWHASFSLPQY